MNDPFAAAPEEAQTEQAPEPTTVGSVKVRVEPDLSAFRDFEPVTKAEIVTTFKAGASYDQPWVVIHAGSVKESDALLDQEFADYLAKVKKVAGFFNGGAASGSTNSGSRPVQLGQPQGSVEAPSWAPPKPFDDFVYVTKVSPKTGKPWHAWMSPTKGDNREPLFFNPPR